MPMDLKSMEIKQHMLSDADIAYMEADSGHLCECGAPMCNGENDASGICTSCYFKSIDSESLNP